MKKNTSDYSRKKFLPRMAGAKFFMAVVCLIGFLVYSCNDENTIGLDVQPEGDLLNSGATDTVSITTFSVREDSVKTDDLPSGTAVLGSYNDPVFGITKASIYSQFLLPTNNPAFTGAVIDSVVVALAYERINPFYGSVNDGDLQTVKVYQLNESISKESSYYSNQELEFYPFPVGQKTFAAEPTDSVQVGSVKEKSQLRIKLDNPFGQLLLDAGATNLSSNSSFLQYFKGLYIEPENLSQSPGEGAILYFNLLDATSGVILYYKINGVSQTPYKLVSNSSAARFGHFEHDYPSGGAISNQLANPSSGQQLSYLQSLAGLKTKVMFPNIKNLKDSNVVINRAELIIKADPSTITTSYYAPEKLFVVPVTSTGSNGDILFWPDFAEGAGYYGGTLDKAASEYRFNITHYIQSLVTGNTPDYGLYITVSGSAVNASRLVIGGNANSSNPLKLRLTYSKLN